MRKPFKNEVKVVTERDTTDFTTDYATDFTDFTIFIVEIIMGKSFFDTGPNFSWNTTS